MTKEEHLKKQREFSRNHYNNNKQYYYERNKRVREERRKWFAEYMQDKSCICCGEAETCCLDHHHLDPAAKEDHISNLISGGKSIEKVLAELSKCVVVCSNCHRKIHKGLIEL